MAQNKIKVLFLCTGNACRSQIAEGWDKYLKSDVMQSYSAGVSPAEQVNSRAISVMAEAGVDISKQKPKHVETLLDIDFDYIVTVCDYAREQCPVFPDNVRHFHKLYSDPSFMDASEEDIMTAFRKLRDDIREFVKTMPESLQCGNI